MRLLADLSPLRESPDFRRLWWGLGISAIGHQITVITVSLEAYHLTQSTFSVGLIGLSELLPLVVFGLYGGAIVDRVDRRLAALIASSVLWLTVLGLALQAAFAVESVAVLYALVAIQAAAFAVNAPARMAITPRLVRAEKLPAANALQGVTGNLAMTIGPVAGAAIVATSGFVASYVLHLILMGAALWAIWKLPPILPESSAAEPSAADSPAGPPRRFTGLASVLDGLRYLATRPNVRMTFLVDLSAMVFAMPRVVFPALGVLYLGGGETTSGVLITAIAVGGILAATFSGPLGRIHRHGVAISWAVAGWGISIALFGLVIAIAGPTRPVSPVWWAIALACVALMAAGACDSVSAIFRQSVLQSATPDDMRGRLQGVFIVVVAGGPRLGDLTLGTGARWVGEGWVVLIGGLLCVAVLVLLLRFGRRFLAYDSRHPEP